MNNQKKAAKDGMDMYLYVILALILVAAGVLSWVYYDRKIVTKSVKVMVYIDNRCELVDEAFMAVSDFDGQRAYFEKGVAVLETNSRSRIFIKSSDRFPDFHFETGKHKAEPKVVITTNCGDRIDQTMDAMREQFKNRQK
jgi:hypothetical protein